MKKLITLLLALLFILTACTPAVVEQAPAIEVTPEPTEESNKPTVIVLSGRYEHLGLNNFGIGDSVEKYCASNEIEYHYIDATDNSNYDMNVKRYEELLKSSNRTVVIYEWTATNSFLEISEKYGVETILFNASTSIYGNGGYELFFKHIVSYDKEAFAEFVTTEIAKTCDGKSALSFESHKPSGVGDPIDHLLDDKMKENKGKYDLEKTETISVEIDDEQFDLNEEGIQRAYWEVYFENIDTNVDQVCLFTLLGKEEWYLDQLYNLGLTDEEIFHLDYGIANEANIKKMTDGKSDVFYGYTEEAMNKLLISTIDRIFAGEEVEEYICVEPIILTSKEQAQAYYEEHFA